MRLLSSLALSGFSFVAAAGVATAAIDGPVGRDAEKGDPARWYEPAATPHDQYLNAMQEAQAALAEALKDCRLQGAAAEAARDCEREARERHADDVERARGFLVRSTLA